MATKKPPEKKPSPAPKPSTALVKKEAGTISTSLMKRMKKDAGAGTEDMGREDMAIPMLSILQPMSPQVTKGKTEFLENAAAGDIYNNVTHELYADITIIPVDYRRTFIEWWPRESKMGKGFVREHSIRSDIMEKTTRNDKNQDMLPGGTYLANTTQHYCLLVDEDGKTLPQQVVISMTSTQLKKAKKWNTMMKMKVMIDDESGEPFSPPMYAYGWKLGSQLETNDKGSWYGWTFEDMGEITDERVYEMAAAFYTAVRSGAVKVKLEDEEAAQDGATAPY